mgnify:CR=1 FL=1
MAVDLGSKTGYATWDYRKGLMHIGTERLATAKELKVGASQLRRLDPRVQNLHRFIGRVVDALPGPVMVTFEDVEFLSYTKQTQLWASLRAALWIQPRVQYFDCVPVGTLKKFATGHGGANKETMERAFLRDYRPDASLQLDDNAIDAYFILQWTLKKYGL